MPCNLSVIKFLIFLSGLYLSNASIAWASLAAQTVNNLPATHDTWIQPLGWKDPLEKGMANHYSILAWRISWTKEPDGLQYQFSSVAQSCLILWDPTYCSTPGLPVHNQLPKPTLTHVHRVSDVIQPSHPLLSPSPPAFNLPQHQGLFKWVSSSNQVAKLLEFQLQHQSFQWIFRTDLL